MSDYKQSAMSQPRQGNEMIKSLGSTLLQQENSDRLSKMLFAIVFSRCVQLPSRRS